MAITLGSLPAIAQKILAAPAPVPMLDGPASVALSPGTSVSGASAGETSPFSAVLAEAVGRVQSYEATSQTSIAQFLDGADIDLHQVALNVQKAETSFELFSEVRNKVVQAYQEIMRLQV
jgi:flagellar hook-basal body complex protein FliE